MIVARNLSELPTSSLRRGFVPTLGNLHAGHIALVEAARRLVDEVYVSIFVNPTQFRPGEDYERYPRTPELDLALCEASGVDCVFMPKRETMYPAGDGAVSIHVGEIGDRWEGADRPGHFDGVATVVANLFLIVKPHIAIFGQKDIQQVAVIRRLAAGLRLGVAIHVEPTVRETDGLAMSSRNAYLSAKDRAIAPQLYQALTAAQTQLRDTPDANVEAILNITASQLDSQFVVQYLALVNRETMEPTTPRDHSSTLIVAVRLGGTRLIDNVSIYDDSFR